MVIEVNSVGPSVLMFTRNLVTASCSFLLFIGYSSTVPMTLFRSRNVPSLQRSRQRKSHLSTPSFLLIVVRHPFRKRASIHILLEFWHRSQLEITSPGAQESTPTLSTAIPPLLPVTRRTVTAFYCRTRLALMTWERSQSSSSER